MASTINASTSAGLVNTADTSGVLQLQTANTTALTVDGSQNVGIGTVSPTNKLHVQSANSEAINVSDSAAGGNAQIKFSGSRTYQIGVGNASSGFAGSLYFYDATAGAERMRIDSSGRLCVNVTSAYTTGSYISVYGATALAARVVTDGDYAIRFLNAGSASLVGSVSVSSSSTAYNTSSDYRLKEDIAPMTGALAKVAQLKPVTYKWKADGTDAQGFIAHELQAVVPECVSGEKDAVDDDGNPKYQGIDTSFLVATLTAAIQELKAINDTQAETINALTARIVVLEGK